MENRLEALTSKIYQEGIERANEEAERIIASAKKESETIRSKAEQEASATLEKAKKEAQELQRNALSEIRLSARQAVSALKQKITEMIVTETTGDPVKEAFRDKEFLKKIIEMTIKNWNPEKDTYDLQLLLPAKDEKDLTAYFKDRQKVLLNGTLDIRFDDHINAGFKIGPKDGRFLISFTDEDFMNFFKEYLRPATTRMLYGEE